MRIPQRVELTSLTTPDGTLAAYGPGEKPVLSLKDWRSHFRDQQVAFRLAREICVRWQADNGAAAVPVQQLFPRVAFAAKRFLAEKLDCKGDSQPCDVLLVGEYMQAAASALLDAIKKGSSTTNTEIAVVPQGAAGRGSTLYVDFHTTKPISCSEPLPPQRDGRRHAQVGADRCDDARLSSGRKKMGQERTAGIFIPYRRQGLPARYIPDFIVVTDTDQNVIVEIKGQMTDSADIKAKAASRWTAGVARLGTYGTWHYLLVTDPGRLGLMLNAFTKAGWDQGQFELK